MGSRDRPPYHLVDHHLPYEEFDRAAIAGSEKCLGVVVGQVPVALDDHARVEDDSHQPKASHRSSQGGFEKGVLCRGEDDLAAAQGE